MIKNYLLIAVRNLLKNKSYVIINTFGLGIALACCITAYLLLAFNIEFDNFHADEKVDNIYRMHGDYIRPNGEAYQNIVSPINLPAQAASEISGLNKYTRFIGEGAYVRHGDNSFNEYVSFADSTFFDMFDFPLTQGSHASFQDIHSIYLSEKTAKKYFKDQNPIGQILTMNFVNQNEINVVVKGVVKKFPLNSTFAFDFLMRMEHFHDIHDIAYNDWKQWREPTVFYEVSSHEQVPTINKQLDKYIDRRNKEKTDQVVTDYNLEHFKSSFDQDDIRWSQVNLRISIIPLIVFVTMGMMILLIACFNMTNTSIAMTAKRLKEVGVRKVIGAGKWQIISQFLFETLLVIGLALITGLAMSQIIVPAFSNMWGLEYGMEDLSGLNLLVTLLILMFFTSLLAGIYPAIFNSKFQPVTLLKGNVRLKGTNFLTRSLITIQFAISVIVLVAGVLFIQNTKFQEKIDFRYDLKSVVTLNVKSEKEFEVMESKILQNPKTQEVGVSGHHLGVSSYSVPVVVDTTKYDVRHFGIGKNYLETMGLNLLEGRTLNPENTSDMEGSAVVNKAFLKRIGIEDEPLNRIVKVHDIKRRIVGVVDDHIDNLFRSAEAEPSVYYPGRPEEYQFIVVKTNPDNRGDMVDYLEEVWKNQFPEQPFEARYHEDMIFEGVRETSTNLEKIFIFLTILGGMLSASGIFALASLNVEKRSKEIGIRKALGASVQNIVTLMNREFVIILSMAGALGAIGGFFLTGALLDTIYKYHMTIGVLPIIGCAAFIIAVGLSTTSATILKAARANPVDTLKDE